MKNTLPVLICILFSTLIYAQEPAFVWAKNIAPNQFSSGRSIVIDESGNVYTIGSFTNTVDFDPGPGIFNLISVGSGDIFISKLDASGNFSWAKSFGSERNDQGSSIALDHNGDLYLTGSFLGTVDFDPGPGALTLTSQGTSDAFISKLDGNGNFIWAKSIGGSGSNSSYDIAIDSVGNLYITGDFDGTSDFDPGPGTFNMTSIEWGGDIFISKLNATGNLIWAKRMGGEAPHRGISIAVDSKGNVYTTGDFQGTGDYDPGPGTFNLTSVGDQETFISKLDASGNFLWAKSLGGAGADRGWSVALDATDNVYITGNFEGVVDFDLGPGTLDLASAGGIDVFVTKLDSSGNLLWAKTMGGVSLDQGYFSTVDASGNVYTTGAFSSIADFDPSPDSFYLATRGTDIFITKLDAFGNFVWARNTSSNSSSGSSIAVDALGNVYSTGYFGSLADFDPSLGSFDLSSGGGSNAFVLKWAQPTITTPSFLRDMTIVLDASQCGDDGSISIIPTSGTAPFMYSIDSGKTYVSGPDNGYTFQNLAEGIYQVRLKDADGLESAVLIRQLKTTYPCNQPCTPPTFLNDLTIVLDASCNSSDGNISIIPTSGRSPFLYSLDGGATYILGPDAGYTFNSLAAGTYNLRLRDSRGCESLVVPRKVNGCTTSAGVQVAFTEDISEPTLSYQKEDVLTYPNPSKGLFKVQLQNFVSQKAEVSIFDGKGRLIQKRLINASESPVTEFNVQGKPPGLYYIKVVSNTGIKTSKVLIQ